MKFITLISISVFTLIMFLSPTFASLPPDIEARIREKNRELEIIQRQITDTQHKLDATSQERRTLSRDIQRAEHTIRNLELNMRESEINIDRLTLLIENLTNERADAEINITQSKENIASVIRAIHQKERTSLLITLLSNTSLALSMLEITNLLQLQQTIREEISSLHNLSITLGSNIKEADDKKIALKNEQLNLENRRVIMRNERVYQQTILREARNQEAVYQRQLAELEQRQKRVSDQVEDLEEQLRKDFDVNIAPGRGFLIKPFTGHRRITQPFGSTAFARVAYRTRFHNGIDYGMPVGTPILAAASGRVFAVGCNGRFQYGKYIVIQHRDNFFTLYGHLSRQSVVVGQSVERGELIGFSGNTGFSTGPHLHLGVYQTMALRGFAGAGPIPVGVTMNPADYF